MPDFDSTQSSRVRLLVAGKALFAKHGYEQTPTSSIAREAGTSESQLVRYFGGKAGLLEAIFNESWAPLSDPLQQVVAAAPDPKTAILRIFGVLMQTFTGDHDLAFLFLFEGRRIRGGQQEGKFRKDLDPTALCSALIGLAEGMIRDRLVSERAHKEQPYASEDIQKVFEAVVTGL